MLNQLLRLLRFLFWWLVVLATVSVIGYFLWPLLSGKATALKNGEWATRTSQADAIQMRIEQKFKSFFHISATATTDIFTDESGKRMVEYKKNETGVYMPISSQN
jgi:hypothetical protein